ncbi:hypothetical protein ADEAN_000799400 [Angomonas deanei]|uniref:Uncharacterized protein n=1 Tax=Angomonas deanei TaxID=59799 RepID=A0A7G2CQL2_9TRYP|nr:hypothetical protein ADEAN_000799400 [Angomonas deanei]
MRNFRAFRLNMKRYLKKVDFYWLIALFLFLLYVWCVVSTASVMEADLMNEYEEKIKATPVDQKKNETPLVTNKQMDEIVLCAVGLKYAEKVFDQLWEVSTKTFHQKNKNSLLRLSPLSILDIGVIARRIKAKAIPQYVSRYVDHKKNKDSKNDDDEKLLALFSAMSVQGGLKYKTKEVGKTITESISLDRYSEMEKATLIGFQTLLDRVAPASKHKKKDKSKFSIKTNAKETAVSTTAFLLFHHFRMPFTETTQKELQLFQKMITVHQEKEQLPSQWNEKGMRKSESALSPMWFSYLNKHDKLFSGLVHFDEKSLYYFQLLLVMAVLEKEQNIKTGNKEAPVAQWLTQAVETIISQYFTTAVWRSNTLYGEVQNYTFPRASLENQYNAFHGEKGVNEPIHVLQLSSFCRLGYLFGGAIRAGFFDKSETNNNNKNPSLSVKEVLQAAEAISATCYALYRESNTTTTGGYTGEYYFSETVKLAVEDPLHRSTRQALSFRLTLLQNFFELYTLTTDPMYASWSLHVMETAPPQPDLKQTASEIRLVTSLFNYMRCYLYRKTIQTHPSCVMWKELFVWSGPHQGEGLVFLPREYRAE